MSFDYDVLTIGLGPAGMAVSIMASEMGLRVCAVESHKIGGECMNVGCIPSKALLRIAKVRHTFERLDRFQMESAAAPQLLKPFEGIQRDLQFINEKKTIGMFDKVELILGQGKAAFMDPHTVEVGGRRITARRIFICVGTRPELPNFNGLADVGPLTNDNIFNLKEVPKSLAIIGGGAIACEMAQAFARLGSRVTIIYRGSRLLRREDEEAVKLLEGTFTAENITIRHCEIPQNFRRSGDGVAIEISGGEVVEAERVLVALGRRMELSSLGLEHAGVKYNTTGITVNRYLQSSQRHIYAVGDCNGRHQFSHAAMHQGMLALMNCMLPGPLRRDYRKYVVPWTIFTDPQISHVGARESELKEKGIRYQVQRVGYGDYGAAIAEKIDTGFVKVLTSSTGKLYGATVVGEGSCDMINEWGLAIQKKLRMHDIMLLQHSFPSMAFLNKRVAESWMMDIMRSSGLLRRICGWMYRW